MNGSSMYLHLLLGIISLATTVHAGSGAPATLHHCASSESIKAATPQTRARPCLRRYPRTSIRTAPPSPAEGPSALSAAPRAHRSRRNAIIITDRTAFLTLLRTRTYPLEVDDLLRLRSLYDGLHLCAYRLINHVLALHHAYGGKHASLEHFFPGFERSMNYLNGMPLSRISYVDVRAEDAEHCFNQVLMQVITLNHFMTGELQRGLTYLSSAVRAVASEAAAGICFNVSTFLEKNYCKGISSLPDHLKTHFGSHESVQEYWRRSQGA